MVSAGPRERLQGGAAQVSSGKGSPENPIQRSKRHLAVSARVVGRQDTDVRSRSPPSRSRTDCSAQRVAGLLPTDRVVRDHVVEEASRCRCPPGRLGPAAQRASDPRRDCYFFFASSAFARATAAAAASACAFARSISARSGRSLALTCRFQAGTETLSCVTRLL